MSGDTPTPRELAQSVHLLRWAAEGRRMYAAGISVGDSRSTMGIARTALLDEARAFEVAANLLLDPKRIGFQVPSWLPEPEMDPAPVVRDPARAGVDRG